MTPLDAFVGVMLVALCAHVGLLLVAIGRALLPQRRSRALWVCVAAGAAALAGELLVLRGLVGRPASPPVVGALLGLGVLLGLMARSVWRERGHGRAALHAVVAAPLVVLFVLALSLR
ncbi:MAG TPA: hypothetical protein VM370_12735 [Candidatus Thermoplasmatota archaeon]|nr:hypothetical protein [Candidatus Thermoplasmatota archaeon]